MKLLAEAESLEDDAFYSVLWTRWKRWTPNELENVFGAEYEITHYNWPVPPRALDFLLGGHLTRYEIRVKADTLHALLSSIRAVLYQKEPQRFTERDQRLYAMIRSIYRNAGILPLLPKVEEGGKWRTQRSSFHS